MAFSENLRYIMECRDLSTKELSQKTGIKIDTINSYLKTKGSLPTLEKGLVIAKVLNVTVEDFFKPIDSLIKQSDENIKKDQKLIRPEVLEILEQINKMQTSDLHVIKAMLQLINKNTTN